MNIIVTCYFNSKKDPMNGNEYRQINGFVKGNNFALIRRLYQSVINRKLHMIIFHDSLSDEFINLYQTDKIKFIKKDISSYENSSINDIRFLIYLEYLKVQNNIDKICLVDAFDVVDVVVFVCPSFLFVVVDV